MTDRTVGGADEAAERRAVQQRIAIEVLGHGRSYGEAGERAGVDARAPSALRCATRCSGPACLSSGIGGSMR